MQLLWQASDFVRGVRRRLRFGDLSRAPLQLLRLEVQSAALECEWMARPSDAWDAHVSTATRERNVTEQALQDAMGVRDVLFFAFPQATSANLRVYRHGEPPELIIAGTVYRDKPVLSGIRSLAMRVKLCGLQFRLADGRLEPLPRDHPS